MVPEKNSSRRETGFTLIELLMAIALSGILIVAITTGFITTLRGTATAHDRLVASNGSHTLASYFIADVESANPDLATTATTATMGCASPPPTSPNVLHLQWSERKTSIELRAFSVSYRILASDTDSVSGDDKWQLVRYVCSGSGNPNTTSMATILLSAALTDHVVVDELHEPTGTFITKATITPASRDIELVAYAAAVKGEAGPFSYKFAATMRTPDPAPRVLSIKRNGAATVPATTTSVAWTVIFSEAITNVDTADFALSYTGSLSGASVTSVVPVTNMVYTVTASTSAASGQGTMALTVVDNDTANTITSVADGDRLGGSGPNNGSFTGGGYTMDVARPGVVVDRSATQPAVVISLPAPNAFTVTFNEAVTGFTASDVSNAGSASGVVFSTTPVGTAGTQYTLSVQSATSTGTIIPRVAANAATDSAGNGNVLSTNGPNNIVTYSTTSPPPPTPTITSVDLWNGGAPGTIEKGDKIIVTFSETMSASTFCSSWTSNTTDYVLDSNGKVTVTVQNNTATGGNDKLLVTTGSGVCSFNFGEINLGNNGYVGTNTKFEGNNADRSIIQWFASAKQLVITLGIPDTAPTATIANSPPIYTADTDIKTASTPPGAINNSPVTLADEQQF
jgi:prepilin-type N-terminal cleavage/methylation domain-containing protein